MLRTEHRVSAVPARWMLLIAFASVYVIWGSTYLAIRVAIETMPPFLMLGVRFGVAGALMYGWLRLRGGARPSWRQWRTAAVVGGLMLFVGTGSVAWAEQYIPSGLAALLVTTVPLWMVLLDWLWKGGRRPGGIIFVGLLLGFAGVMLLVDPVALVRHHSVDVSAGAVVFIGALAWATGSIHARSADLPANPFMTTAMQMFAGGVVLMIGGSLLGEWRHFDVSALSIRSFFAWSYLVVFGAFIAFSAYVWLLKNTTVARASTYAYVNPVVAVFLGWSLADEPLNLRIFAAVILLVSAVVLITRHNRSNKRKHTSKAPQAPLRKPAPVPLSDGNTRARHGATACLDEGTEAISNGALHLAPDAEEQDA